MPFANANGTKLYYETTGRGFPIIFVHEFAGDYRSWEPQVRYFCRRYRCITFNARGYPPWDVPERPQDFSQTRATDDIVAILRHLKIRRAHVVGLSMGGFATLHLGLRYPRLARSLVVSGAGYGSEPAKRAAFKREAAAAARKFRTEGARQAGYDYAEGPTRVQFQNKDPRGWTEFRDQLAEHSAMGSALTQLGVQRKRPSLHGLKAKLKKLTVPTLLLIGDEDEPCLDTNLFLKRTIPSAGLAVVPNTGHTVNLEEPAAFNDLLDDFFAQVESGRWRLRDPRSLTASAILPERRARRGRG